MSEYLDLINLTSPDFTVVTSKGDPYVTLSNEICRHPREFASICSYVMQHTVSLTYQTYIFSSVSYRSIANQTPVWLVNSDAEIVTALVMTLHTASAVSCIVVNNENGFADIKVIDERINKLLNHIGQDINICQCKSTSICKLSYANDKVIIINISIVYMSSLKEINDLKCVAGDIASKILKSSHNSVDIVCNTQRWFSKNISYSSIGWEEGRSAVELFIYHKAVCAGISAFALILLDICGVDARYISGMGYSGRSWEPHAWNIVRINNQWLHADFTFGLNYPFRRGPYLMQTSQKFQVDHRWEEGNYSYTENDKQLQYRQILQKSVFVFSSNFPYIVINNAVVEMSRDCRPLICDGNREWILYLKCVHMIGGYYEFLPKLEVIRVTVNNDIRSIPISVFKQVNNEWYYPVSGLADVGMICHRKGLSLIITHR